MNDENLIQSVGKATVELAKPIYDDLAHPAFYETGKILGRIPRLINALCLDFDLWATEREYKLKMLVKDLEVQLKDVDPDIIESPEPYIAVPALQAISYSYNSDELRSMYAHLLSKAMHGEYKADVHPSFVEIIKQLSPIDCLVFKEIVSNAIATFEVFSIIENKLSEFDEPLIYFSASLKSCDSVKQIRISLDNLLRLKLIDKIENLYGSDEGFFASFFDDEFNKFAFELKGDSNNNFEYGQRVFCLTDFGRSFSNICVLDI